jgi:hypothetical protein
MVIDHLAAVVFQIPVGGSWIRLCTRLSMPLFCVLMGYFLEPERRFRIRRLAQIAGAAGIANALFWPHYHRIEILGSLLIAYCLFLMSGRIFPIFLLGLFLYPDDPLRPWFDFPPSIVVAFVAQGMTLRRLGLAPALVSGVVLSSGAIWIQVLEPDGVRHKLLYFLLPATLLVYFGARRPEISLPGLAWLGRRPLTAYLLQYLAIFAIAYSIAFYHLWRQ